MRCWSRIFARTKIGDRPSLRKRLGGSTVMILTVCVDGQGLVLESRARCVINYFSTFVAQEASSKVRWCQQAVPHFKVHLENICFFNFRRTCCFLFLSKLNRAGLNAHAMTCCTMGPGSPRQWALWWPEALSTCALSLMRVIIHRNALNDNYNCLSIDHLQSTNMIMTLLVACPSAWTQWNWKPLTCLKMQWCLFRRWLSLKMEFIEDGMLPS